MRHLPEIPIRGTGAIIPAQIGVGAERRNLLRAVKRLEPEPLVVTMLIDTGATCSWINEAYMSKLGLAPRSWFDCELVDGEEQAPSYEVSLILGGAGTLLVRRFDILIGGVDFKDKPVDGLLGRDILRHVQFVWNGPGANVHMTYL